MNSTDTILVVSDDPGAWRAPERALRDVFPAAQLLRLQEPQAVVERMQAGDVSLVLLDARSPERDALELCRQIRSRDGTFPVPLLLVAPEDAPDTLGAGALEAGADDVLSLALPVDAFLARVKLALRIRRAESAFARSELERDHYKLLCDNADLHARKEHDQLRDSERRTRAWLDCSPVCTKVVDLDFNLRYMSRAGIEGLKIEDISEFYGKPYPFHFYPEEFRAQMTANLEKARDTGTVIEQEASVMDTEGSVRWYHSTLVPVRNDAGELDYLIVVSIDTTERKRMEEDLIQAQKLESLGTIAGGIAHDFNNLLTSLYNRIELARLGIPEGVEARTHLMGAVESLHNARELTSRLLTFARGGSPMFDRVPTADLVQEGVAFHLHGSNVIAEFEFADDLWPIRADRGQIGQVLGNLALNAVQAMPDGGTLRVEGSNVELPVLGEGMQATRAFVRLVVRDEGVGIADEIVERVFDPYFSTKETGHGLGLAIAHSVVRKHEGRISVESEPDRGTSFTILLPAASGADPVPARPAEREASKPERRSLRVLFMDDEFAIRKVGTQLLETLGHSVETARDGEAATRVYTDAMHNGTPFDCVIMDLTIRGGKGGREAIRDLRQVDPDARAIVTTGYSSDPVFSSYRKYGFLGALAKPFLMSELETELVRVTECGRTGP